MAITLKPTEKVSCRSEYDSLARVVVCEPKFMHISEVINETQRHYADENINKTLATNQHLNFVRTLRSHGVEVIELPPHQEFPEQVFTRDIGFTLGSTIFVSSMGSKIRQGEEDILKEWLGNKNVRLQKISDGKMEGGDVLVDGDTIYIGVSGRTAQSSIQSLRERLPEHKVVSMPFNPKYLHLDCVFNILSSAEALVFPQAFRKKELDFLAKRYDLIEVSKEEQFLLGTNVLSIGDKKVFSLPVNPKVNNNLRKRGYEVIEVDLSEIIKSGGSFRCCTMPILRK
ncbi:dimethylarginine dimethylaminohydrolase family protein [Fictibacillus sp. KU28468]|uniref:dimethylarginine dimethylaminohydrolase family protein n=1 Tax=Fictibacillus sp. KU28468 TaxID=2991053 RepID=UPI00223D6034|nr:dimethylarginine dimethylaminohydrolase family protein [Fictibacillus sp. KU28468]UZJ77854.1 dimethylarginine dimethylaminohydrolase family protein [Fictibacillus sp. KU28468]